MDTKWPDLAEVCALRVLLVRGLCSKAEVNVSSICGRISNCDKLKLKPLVYSCNEHRTLVCLTTQIRSEVT